jgi:hypothetical protein
VDAGFFYRRADGGETGSVPGHAIRSEVEGVGGGGVGQLKYVASRPVHSETGESAKWHLPARTTETEVAHQLLAPGKEVSQTS